MSGIAEWIKGKMNSNPEDATTLHDLLTSLQYDYDAKGRRLSKNVEDRRHWKTPPSNDTIALNLDTGEPIPDHTPMVPEMRYPAGDPRWNELNDKYNAAYWRAYEEPKKVENTLKSVASDTLYNIIDKLEKMGWN